MDNTINWLRHTITNNQFPISKSYQHKNRKEKQEKIKIQEVLN